MNSKDKKINTTVRISEELLAVAKIYFDNVSETVNMGMKTMIDFPYTVYVLTNPHLKKYHVGYYLYQDVHDAYWHRVHTLGSNTVGDAVRRFGPPTFEFKVLGKFPDMKAVDVFMKIYEKGYQKKGLTPFARVD